jgi:hypothetical protein
MVPAVPDKTDDVLNRIEMQAGGNPGTFDHADDHIHNLLTY